MIHPDTTMRDRRKAKNAGETRSANEATTAEPEMRRYVRAAVRRKTVIATGSGAGDKRRAFGRDARSSNSGGRAAPASASVVLRTCRKRADRTEPTSGIVNYRYCR